MEIQIFIKVKVIVVGVATPLATTAVGLSRLDIPWLRDYWSRAWELLEMSIISVLKKSTVCETVLFSKVSLKGGWPW